MRRGNWLLALRSGAVPFWRISGTVLSLESCAHSHHEFALATLQPAIGAAKQSGTICGNFWNIIVAADLLKFAKLIPGLRTHSKVRKISRQEVVEKSRRTAMRKRLGLHLFVLFETQHCRP